MKAQVMNLIPDVHPSPKDSRGSFVGVIAVVTEFIGFALVKLFEMGAWNSLSLSTPEHFGYRLFETSFILFLLSAPLAVLGIFVDKKKAVSIFVLATFLPSLVFLVFWSGSW